MDAEGKLIEARAKTFFFKRTGSQTIAQFISWNLPTPTR